MAEAVGLVASVIQVAGAGIQLSKALYEYVDGVATADRRIKDIAMEIKMTSVVIEELGEVFKHPEMAVLMSKSATTTANDTMKECSVLFAQIEITLQKSKKSPLGRLMLPFRGTKIELLRSHIDKLKSTLQLLMQVLTHAYNVASRKLDREAEAKQREEIRQLLEKKDRSTQIHQDLLRQDSASGDSTLVNDDDSGIEKDRDTTPDLVMTASALSSTITTQSLAACVIHVRNLLKDIELLQGALTVTGPGDDHAMHHQIVMDSYFRTRGLLDHVVLGSSKPDGFASLARQSLNEHHKPGLAIGRLENAGSDLVTEAAGASNKLSHKDQERSHVGAESDALGTSGASDWEGLAGDDGIDGSQLGIEHSASLPVVHDATSTTSAVELGPDQIPRENRPLGSKIWTQNQAEQLVSATYIPGGDSFGPGTHVPALHEADSKYSRPATGAFLGASDGSGDPEPRPTIVHWSSVPRLGRPVPRPSTNNLASSSAANAPSYPNHYPSNAPLPPSTRNTQKTSSRRHSLGVHASSGKDRSYSGSQQRATATLPRPLPNPPPRSSNEDEFGDEYYALHREKQLFEEVESMMITEINSGAMHNESGRHAKIEKWQHTSDNIYANADHTRMSATIAWSSEDESDVEAAAGLAALRMAEEVEQSDEDHRRAGGTGLFSTYRPLHSLRPPSEHDQPMHLSVATGSWNVEYRADPVDEVDGSRDQEKRVGLTSPPQIHHLDMHGRHNSVDKVDALLREWTVLLN